jgi:ribokinase
LNSSDQKILAGAVLVVGSICIDLVSFSKRMPTPGETIIGDDFQLVLGGKGSNQAIAAALAGSPSVLVSCVGDDLFSDFAKQTLLDFGVNTQAVKVVSGPTGIAHIRVDDKGENNIVVVPLANSKLSKTQIDEAFEKTPTAKVLLLQLEIPWELNEHAIKLAKAKSMTIVLDPAPAAELPSGAWEQIDICTPNESEAKAITGIAVTDNQTAELAGQWFVERGVKNAIITMGGAGVMLVNNQGSKHFAAPKVKVVDTTAAGDAFAGYLGALIAQGQELETAISMAVKAASISVTKVGASPSLPKIAQVEEYVI